MSNTIEVKQSDNQNISSLEVISESRVPHNNFLLWAAKPLLSLMTTIKEVEECRDIVLLRDKILDQIRYFEYRCNLQKYPSRTILAVRYALCTALDEVVLKTPWGRNSIWLQQSLLVTLHHEWVGGEKFYIILEEFLKSPEENYHALELFYNILSLGFEGKFYNDPMAWLRIRNNLFRILQKSKKREFTFSVGSGIFLKKSRLFFLPIWMILLLSGSLLLCITLLLEQRADRNKVVIYSLLDKIKKSEQIESHTYKMLNLNGKSQ